MTTMALANEDIAARQRLDTFKLGGPMPAMPTAMSGGSRTGHRHQRSHSRNASISSSSSLSLSSLASSRSSGLNDMSGFTFGGLNSSSSNNSCTSGNSSLASSTSSSTSSGPPHSRRSSHHRRKSSVSTRRESAEMMGVTLPELPPPTSDYGDKDSIRRRALWALEGKQDVAFTKVEIPELSTPDADKLLFDFSSKSSLVGGPSGFGNSLMGSKRDSFKLLASSASSKDQLHTLLEEEEEEEDESISHKSAEEMLPSPVSDETHGASACEEQATPCPSIPITKPALGKPRPATLNLRPLSLVPDTTVIQGLPTPSLSPTPRGGLRRLSLILNNKESPLDAKQTRVDSVAFLTNTRHLASGGPARNTSIDSTTSSDDGSKPSRRSSISYKISGSSNVNAAGLPTPEMTPTFGRRASLAESNQIDDEFFLGSQQQGAQKPLTASEQHFLLKSHKTLVARITDLERALSRRMSMGGYSTSSRPSSIISDMTVISESSSMSSVPAEPSDEMLTFIRDLKAERDELKKDVEGWRTRVNDLDRKHALLAKRVETERWEAWAARSRVSILESEKVALEKKLEDLDKSFAELENDKASLEAANHELQLLNEEKDRRINALEEELERLKNELRKEQELHQQQVAAIRSSSMDSDLLATPTPQTFLAQPPSSTTSDHLGLGLPDDQPGDAPPFAFSFIGVTEGHGEVYSDDDNGLASYEDEDDFDDSYDDQPTQYYLNRPDRVVCSDEEEEEYCDEDKVLNSYSEDRPARSVSPLRGELSSAWSFPRSKSAPADAAHQKHRSVDRFFNCLDESDATDDSAPPSPLSFDYEQSKDMFARGLNFASEDDAPFFLPPGIGAIVDEPEPKIDAKTNVFLMPLAEVEEEQEEEAEQELENDTAIFGEELSGIRITFTPPDEVEEVEEPKQIQVTSPVKSTSPPPVLPDLNFGFSVDEDDSFMFGLPPSAPDLSPSPSSSSAPFVDLLTSPAEHPHTPKIIMPPTPPPTLPRSASPRFASPSSIPRPISRQSRNSVTESPSPKSFAVPFPVYTTPPTKRSFIPQPVSPARNGTCLKARTSITPPTFTRPPGTRISPATSNVQPNIRGANGSAFTPQPALNQPSMAGGKVRLERGLTRSRK